MTHLTQIRQRLWLLAAMVAIVFTVLVGGVGVVGGEAFAADGQSSCCCGSSESAQSNAGAMHHQKMQGGMDCHDSCQEHGCSCHISPDNNTPGGQTLALTSSTISFAPALPAQANAHIRLPEPRAPGVVRPTAATDSPHPSQPIYLLNSILLI